MNERTIRCPKGPAIIFLIQAISVLFTVFSTALIGEILDNSVNTSFWGIFRIGLLGATNLFMSIVLFSKKYNNMLIVAAGVLLIPCLFTLFFGVNPYLISEIVFFLLFTAFTYITVKMPETPIREKAVKLRFIIPVFQFVLILISTIQTVQGVYEKFVETTGAYPEGTVNAALLLLPSILGAVTGFLPVLCYALLVNWLAEPYEK